MGERGVGNPWTTYEDNLLIQAVAIHGENDNWKSVASLVPGRTNKACRKRWLHSLSPNVKKTAWTPEEDQLLLTLYATHGTKWSIIARNIPGRTDDACSKRYREALDPSLKRDDWTSEEDNRLLDAYARLGGKWGVIGQELNRSGLGCRNRWRMLERRRAAMSRDHAGPSGPTSTVVESTTPHWTPPHVPEPSFWDGGSPQYIAPSALYQGSPPHPQESHAASFSPEQILSGAHLGGQSSRARSPAPFQYTSSSLSAALSQPGSVTHSPNPHAHGYYPSQAYSPRHEPSELSSVNISSSNTRSGAYETHDYEYLPHDDTALSGSYQHGTGHTAAGISTNELTGNSSSGDPVSLHSVTIPESPASPSQAGSPSPPGSPVSSSGGDPADFSNLPATGDTVTAPRSYYLTDAEKALRPPPPRKVRNPLVPARLSSSLAATADPSVLAYACGHRDCWPEDAMTSRNAYVTSKELSDHSKVDHGGDLGGSRPFRCGLTGCEKSWKSINGLQYHLQISKYHFQQALATRTDNPDLGGSAAPATPSIGQETGEGEVATSGAVESPCGAVCAEAEGTAPSRTHAAPVPQRTPGPEKTGSGTAPPAPDKPKRKLHPCPHPGCSKEYKQLSGLRYHLTHGHADALPLQLDVVPPTLARMVAEKEGLTRH